MTSNSAQASPTSPEGPSAAKELQEFLTEKGIELRLTPPMVRQVEAGGLMIDQPQIIANYKEVSSIAN